MAKRYITQICESPVLVDLDLLWAPLALVNVCCPALKNLRVFHPSLGTAAEVVPAVRTAEIVLESLELWSALNGVTEFFLGPASNFRFNQLQELQVTAYFPAYHSRVQKFLDFSGGSLEVFRFTPATQVASPIEHIISVSHCHRLTTLHLTIDATNLSYRGADPLSLPWTASFISRIPPHSAIETILTFNLRTLNGGLESREGSLMSRALRDIGSFVSSPKSLPRLEALEVEIQSHRTNDAGTLRTWALEALAIPPEKNLLHLL